MRYGPPAEKKKMMMDRLMEQEEALKIHLKIYLHHDAATDWLKNIPRSVRLKSPACLAPSSTDLTD